MLANLSAAQLPVDAVEVGKIGDAWGLKGWFKVQPHSAQAEALFSCAEWWIQHRVGSQTSTYLLPVASSKNHADGVVAMSLAVPDRTVAQQLRGARIFIGRSSFPPLGPGEFYWVDLIGLAVLNREGLAMGLVTELLTTGPHAVLVMAFAAPDGKVAERMIPFVDAFIDQVDLVEKTIRVDWQSDY